LYAELFIFPDTFSAHSNSEIGTNPNPRNVLQSRIIALVQDHMRFTSFPLPLSIYLPIKSCNIRPITIHRVNAAPKEITSPRVRNTTITQINLYEFSIAAAQIDIHKPYISSLVIDVLSEGIS